MIVSMTSPPAPGKEGLLGAPHVRIDGPAKVTGSAIYSSDIHLPGMCHAALVLGTIPKGSIVGFRLRAASEVVGVLDIFPIAISRTP